MVNPAERMDLWFLFLAYSALFAIFFVFMGRMLRISRQLEREVARLKEAWDERSADTAAPAPTVTPNVQSRLP
jgi:hypothetical protein